MSAINKFLQSWQDSVTMVVYLGAGCGDALAQVGALRAPRAFLIEGNPAHAAELERAVANVPGVRVMARVVTPEGGAVTWHRYDLQALSGPLEASGLKTYYPRLRELERTSVNSVAIQALLDELPMLDDGSAMLVIDLPGQEDALLAACTAEQLRRFSMIAVRGCSQPLYRDAPLASAAIERLNAQRFKTLSSDTDTEPLWPLTAMGFDQAAYELEQLRDLVAGLQEQLAIVAKARDEKSLLLEQCRAEVEEVARSRVVADKLLAERDAQIRSLTEAKAQAEKASLDRQAHIEQLAATKAAADKLLAERDAQVQSLTAAKAQVEKARQELQERHDVLGRALRQVESRAAASDSQLKRLELLVAEQERRQVQVDDEMARVEGQLDLVRQLLLPGAHP